MAKHYSPLRYPGGKAKLYNLVKEILQENDLINQTYVEPFAGGAGLALSLLLNGDVRRIVINDADPAIYAFWYCVLHHNNELCDFVATAKLNVSEWEKQKKIYTNQEKYEILDVAKAVLYLNRTNRSGVLKAGMIGGKSQSGIYTLDARFNRMNLVKKLKLINTVSNKIDLYNLDVIDFLNPAIIRKYYNVLINFDPPYVEKGAQLYHNYFNENDHKNLRQYITKCKRKWILTYDDCSLTRELYRKNRCSLIDINYSVETVRKAKELIVFSPNLTIPKGIKLL